MKALLMNVFYLLSNSAELQDYIAEEYALFKQLRKSRQVEQSLGGSVNEMTSIENGELALVVLPGQSSREQR